MDVQFGVRCGRGRRQQLVEQAVETFDLRADQLDQFAFAGVALCGPAGQQLGRPFNPASGLRSSWARPFSAALSALGRAWVGSSREFVDRMRLQQPAAIVAPAHPALGETRRLAGHRQRQPVQAQAVALIACQEVGQGFALHFQCGQWLAQQAATADAQPAPEGRVAADDAAIGPGPGQRRAQGFKGRRRCGVGHCTNVVQNAGFVRALSSRKGI